MDHCDNPAEDILEEDKLAVILNSWKNDYRQWMRPETLANTWEMNPQEWGRMLRRAFRSHLWQIAGSWEMAVFFIVAPFSNYNLEVFRYFSNQVASEWLYEEERNGRILKLSKDWVRWSV